MKGFLVRANEAMRTFHASHAAVAFPLGGIGTGNVSLGARGDLRDWEIFNAPAKGNLLPNTFFAIRTHTEGQAPITRVLEGPVQPPHLLSHGYFPTRSLGLPRLRDTTFRGEYPFATIEFSDPSLPVHVELEAYTPLVPLNPEDSGIPCAIFTFSVTNTSDQPVALTLAASLTNPVGGICTDKYGNIQNLTLGQNINDLRDEGDFRGLFMHSVGIEGDALEYGDLSLVTDHPRITSKRAWLRGKWFDFLREFWDDFEQDGLLTDLGYDEPNSKPDTGSLGLLDTLAPGASGSYRFILTWYFPNRRNSWDASKGTITRNHYATRFGSSWEAAAYVFRELPRLESATRQFHDALFNSTLPPAVLDAISANIVPVRSNTCFWMEDGRFFGWEGCFDDAGCCPGSCTHVWSYAQTAAFLFPSLEREMRRIEFAVETEDDGYMAFRNFKTFGDEFLWAWGDQKPEAAVDGQMGCILRVYREWQLSGDRQWLALVWEGVKRSIDYASVHWDTDHDGVLDGRQHNTYDIEFFGPNPLSSVYYLAALRAVEELANVMGEPDVARRCREAFELGSQRVGDQLWGGEYYVQRLDNIDDYMYQHGEGCLTDQLLGQLHARILDLGDLLPQSHVRSALRAVFNHNFKRDFHDHVCCNRSFVLNDDSGLVICSWPEGAYRPRFPMVYADEVMSGMEYQAAVHMIYEGNVEDGLTIVKAIRDRHDGMQRNPWDEVECGHHYARTMVTWALLLAFSGAHADLGRGTLRFDPIPAAFDDKGVFQTLWSTGKAWGSYRQERDPGGSWRRSLQVFGGDLDGVRVSAQGEEIQP